MSEIILHHYWPSPVAEKVRVVLGMKRLAWRSVEIPRVPPKPDVIALTGGYRRTPVMQIGADIYCDSQCIIRELERRFPEPRLHSPLVWGLSRWTDGELFSHVIRVVLGSKVDSLDEAFLSDRARLYFGSNWTADSIRDGVEHSLSQVDTAFGWMNNALAGQGPFLTGESARLPDAFCYYLCWFLRGRFDGGPDLIDRNSHLAQWVQRVAAIGHGQHSDFDSTAALAIARAETSPYESLNPEPDQPPGTVAVAPDGDGGDPEVIGTLVHLDSDEIVVKREDERAGIVCVHFPRTGYILERFSAACVARVSTRRTSHQ